jgi:hypothetical protein
MGHYLFGAGCFALGWLFCAMCTIAKGRRKCPAYDVDKHLAVCRANGGRAT